MSLNAVLTEWLTLSGAYGYTNARFREFKDGVNDYAGNCIPYAPQSTASATLSYRVGINSSWLEGITISATGRGAGKIYWNERNDIYQPFYATLDGSLRFEGEIWSVDFWARNITNTRYDLFYFESMGNAFLQRARGTSVGIRLNLDL